jgi:hypothetical protein
MTTRYYHGGVRGLKAGDTIKPGNDEAWKHEGCAWCESSQDDNHIPEHIFVTTSKEYARYYASRAHGDLYEVIPNGELSLSDADFFVTFHCTTATVKRRLEKKVRLTHEQRLWLFRQMGGTKKELKAMQIAMGRQPTGSR